MTDQQALMILNTMKSTLSQFGHGVDMAMQDGKIDAIEGITMISQGTNMGLQMYYQFVRLKDDLETFLSVLDRAKFTLD